MQCLQLSMQHIAWDPRFTWRPSGASNRPLLPTLLVNGGPLQYSPTGARKRSAASLRSGPERSPTGKENAADDSIVGFISPVAPRSALVASGRSSRQDPLARPPAIPILQLRSGSCGMLAALHQRYATEPHLTVRQLPPELIAHVFRFLSAPDLYRASNTCASWRRVANSRSLWLPWLHKHIPQPAIPAHVPDWVHYYAVRRREVQKGYQRKRPRIAPRQPNPAWPGLALENPPDVPAAAPLASPTVAQRLQGVYREVDEYVLMEQ